MIAFRLEVEESFRKAWTKYWLCIEIEEETVAIGRLYLLGGSVGKIVVYEIDTWNMYGTLPENVKTVEIKQV